MAGHRGARHPGSHTGDDKIYVDLVDNVRFDHDFTVFGEVVSGREVADSGLAGDVIVRAEVFAGR
jgi:cyclophilin family peptidyl-prolyl cis-trans isomerase